MEVEGDHTVAIHRLMRFCFRASRRRLPDLQSHPEFHVRMKATVILQASFVSVLLEGCLQGSRARSGFAERRKQDGGDDWAPATPLSLMRGRKAFPFVAIQHLTLLLQT